MKLSFKRITSSGSFIPEIDGLRFIAITSVVLFHVGGYLAIKDTHVYRENIDYSFIRDILSRGHLGVSLFFVISGFILGFPFAKFRLGKGEPVNLKNYFLRRLTRLEPPYIVAMTLLLFAWVLAETISLKDGLISYLCSITYTHNFFYGSVKPILNSVAWSLEIEVQFYILAPLMAYLFCIRSASRRRLFICALALLFLVLNNIFQLPFLSLFNFIQFFLIGFLLADLYISKSSILPKSKYDYLFAFLFFITIWSFDKNAIDPGLTKLVWTCIQLASIFFFYYYVLFLKVFKFLSFRLITNLGGMCYSIYLLHYPLISLFGATLLTYSFSPYGFINSIVYAILILTVVLLVSSVFFLLIERPCMKKDWYKNIFSRQPSTQPSEGQRGSLTSFNSQSNR